MLEEVGRGSTTEPVHASTLSHLTRAGRADRRGPLRREPSGLTPEAFRQQWINNQENSHRPWTN